MKKLMIALAATAMAIGAQASKVNWTSSVIPYTVDAANVIDNGSYAAGGSETMKAAGTFAYTLEIFTAGGDAFDSVSGTMNMGTTMKIATTGITLNKDLANGVDYKYIITITGASAALSAKPEQEVDGYVYNYSGAQLETELTGTVTGKSGSAGIVAAPTSWTVSGITKSEAPGPGPTPVIPEPTSGLLLLLGVAGLALRRRRA